jgi:hypothetical protein
MLNATFKPNFRLGFSWCHIRRSKLNSIKLQDSSLNISFENLSFHLKIEVAFGEGTNRAERFY